MNLYVYPTQENPTEQQVLNLRRTIINSLTNDSSTWLKLERGITISNAVLPLFTHIKEQYQNEPFYFRYGSYSVNLLFENGTDEGSKSMVIGMLVYYLRYNLSAHIRKIEIR